MKQERYSYRLRKEFCSLLMTVRYQSLARVIQLCEMITSCRGVLIDMYSARDVADSCSSNNRFYCSLYAIKLETLITIGVDSAYAMLSELYNASIAFDTNSINTLLISDLENPLNELIGLLNGSIINSFFKELKERLEK